MKYSGAYNTLPLKERKFEYNENFLEAYRHSTSYETKCLVKTSILNIFTLVLLTDVTFSCYTHFILWTGHRP